MKLAALLREIQASPGPLIPAELAGRLGIPQRELRARLDALRASGQLREDALGAPVDETCAAAGSCAAACLQTSK